MTCPALLRCFKTSPEVMRAAVMLDVRFPRSTRNVEDLPDERGIDISHEMVRVWQGRSGQHFAAEVGRGRVEAMHPPVTAVGIST
jgi:putative transposase